MSNNTSSVRFWSGVFTYDKDCDLCRSLISGNYGHTSILTITNANGFEHRVVMCYSCANNFYQTVSKSTSLVK